MSLFDKLVFFNFQLLTLETNLSRLICLKSGKGLLLTYISEKKHTNRNKLKVTISTNFDELYYPKEDNLIKHNQIGTKHPKCQITYSCLILIKKNYFILFICTLM